MNGDDALETPRPLPLPPALARALPLPRPLPCKAPTRAFTGGRGSACKSGEGEAARGGSEAPTSSRISASSRAARTCAARAIRATSSTTWVRSRSGYGSLKCCRWIASRIWAVLRMRWSREPLCATFPRVSFETSRSWSTRCTPDVSHFKPLQSCCVLTVHINCCKLVSSDTTPEKHSGHTLESSRDHTSVGET